MNRYSTALLLSILLFGPGTKADEGTTAAVGTPLQPFAAQLYLTKKRTTIGEITITLQPNEDEWMLTSNGEAKGLAALFVHDTMQEVTRFRFNNNCIKPLHYTNTKSEDEDGAHPETVFDWNALTAHVKGKDVDTTVSLKPNTMNEHLIMLALMRDVGKPDIKQMSYNVLVGIKEEEQSFVKGEPEKIRVDAGEFNTIKVIREHGSRITYSWHSIDHQYFPVKMERYKNGKLKSTMSLKSYKLLASSTE